MAARLDGIGHQPIVDQIDLGDMLGACKGRIDSRLVAQVPLIDRVVGSLGVDLRHPRVLRACEVGDGRQGLILDAHLLGGVLGLIQRLADDNGDVVSDVAHLALGERRMHTRFHG
jgi:hypothetical protein